MRHKKQTFPDHFRRNLGLAIAKRRKAKKLTQDDLAGIVEVDAETISRFERGTSLPSLERLWAVAQALDVGMSDFFEEASGLRNDRIHRLTTIFDDLRTVDQQLLLDFAILLKTR